MDGEIYNFIKVWLTVFASLLYCYYVGKIRVPIGFTRFICLLPIVCLFFALPLNLDSIHLGGLTAFFIAWLANFKLLLFSFGKGPLSSTRLSTSPLLFVAAACLPIKIQQSVARKPHLDGHSSKKPSQGPHSNGHKNWNLGLKKDQNSVSFASYATKCVLFALLLYGYEFSEYIPSKIILVVYCLHIWIVVEMALAISARLARTMFGIELEPQFNEPYLSTSLQDFWGRRWNLVVTSILRPTIYEPSLKLSTRVIGRKWAPLPSVLATFLVSAIMHEVIFYYLGRMRPTWEITCFFLIHGVCLVVEIAVKKAVNGKLLLPKLVSVPLTLGFVVVTAFWLFFPPLLRCKGDVRAFVEYAAVGTFLTNLWQRWHFCINQIIRPLVP